MGILGSEYEWAHLERLMQEEEDEVQEDLRANIQMEGEGLQELAHALVDWGPQILLVWHG